MLIVHRFALFVRDLVTLFVVHRLAVFLRDLLTLLLVRGGALGVVLTVVSVLHLTLLLGDGRTLVLVDRIANIVVCNLKKNQ